MRALIQDLRFALRGWRRRPRFTGALIAMLALGLGATITVFAVAYAVLWQPWPIAHPERIINFNCSAGNFEFGTPPVTYHKLLQAPGFDAFAAVMGYDDMQLGAAGQRQTVTISRATPTLLPLLGLRPELGRNFAADETELGRQQVVVLSDQYWREHFGADPYEVGRTLQLDGKLYTVIGVAPQALSHGLENASDLWLPLEAAPWADSSLANTSLDVYARLRPGLTWKQAKPAFAAFAVHLHPILHGMAAKLSGMTWSDRLAPDATSRNGMLALLGVVGLVLLIACANVAGLLLARGLEREPEMAVRRALGATRGRIVRQLLAEGGLLAGAAVGLGLLLAHWGIALMRQAPLRVLRLDESRLRPAVIGFAVAAAVICVLVSSLGPALRLSTPRFNRRQRARGAFIVAEVALALMLLVGAGLLANSLWRLYHVDTGLDAAHLVAVEFYLPQPPERLPPAQEMAVMRAFAGRTLLAAAPVLQRASAVPGWRAALAASAPLHSYIVTMVELPGSTVPQGFELHGVGPNYFAVVGQRIVQGRNVAASDTSNAPKVAIVNESWARKYSPQRSPLGLVMREPWPGGSDSLSVIGVVSDARDIDPSVAPRPEVYFPLAQAYMPFAAVVVNTQQPAAAATELRRFVSQLIPAATIRTAEPVLGYTAVRRALPQFRSIFLAAFAGLALVFALAGIWAQVAFAVGERRREFGIRMALGAQGGDIVGQAMRHISRLTAVGIALGVFGAWVATRLLQAMLFNVKPADPATFVVVTVLFAAVALGAAYFPARRALRIDPASVLGPAGRGSC